VRIAVIIPCLDEAAAIAKVVEEFRAAVPAATIYVYDNGSTDRTREVAAAAGAVVRGEPRPGKGNVVRRMFQDVEADVYVMVDGDDTYDPAIAPQLIARLVDENLDMVVGKRVETHVAAYRPGHRLGNRVLTGLVRRLFGSRIDDMLSGYRVFSRRFVKSFPTSSREFEIETELTVHALQMRMAVAEVETRYKERPVGSTSKLRTFRDGWRILLTIMNLTRNERPLLFFALVAAALFATAIALSIPVLVEFADTGYVPRLPTALVSTGLAVAAVVCLGTGLILDLVSHVRREVKRLAYLQHPAPGELARGRSPSPTTPPEPFHGAS
jgi:glycosyltransferase involved in cell wall biosynthesis